MLHSLESQGVRKFTVQCRGERTAALKLWVFSPNLAISSSASETPEPMQVMKVMWQDCPPNAAVSDGMNAQSLSEGDIDIPDYEFQELLKALQSSALLLPENARVFQAWRVSLLRRFTDEDLKR